MKAAYLLDQSVNIVNAPEWLKALCKPVMDGDSIVDWKIAAGTVVEGQEALFRVSTGQAAPIDDECATACGLTEAELQRNQRHYMSGERGITDKKDYELFMAHIIDGYEPGFDGPNRPYIHGKNWAMYEQAKAEVKETGSKI